MKASRAPGPVSYMQMHAKGKSNLDQNSKKPSAKSSKFSVSSNGGNGGVLKKFKDLDNIPDFSWGDANEMAFAFDDNEEEEIEDCTVDYGRNNSGNNSDTRHHHNDCSGDEDEDIADDAHGWSSPHQQQNKSTLYQTKSADAAVSARSVQSKIQSAAPSSQFRSNFNSSNKNSNANKNGVSFSQPKTAPSKLHATYDSDEDNINSNTPDLFGTPPKKSQYSPKKPVANNLNEKNAKLPPPLPFQQMQQEKAAKACVPLIKATTNVNNANKANVYSSSQYQSQENPLRISVPRYKNVNDGNSNNSSNINNNNNNNNNSFAPPLPCEKPLNMPKQHSSPKSPSHLTDKDKLFYTKQPRQVEFKPYTLEQYKLIKATQYTEIQGKLKPDLNTEELIAKRKNAERIKEFSKQLRHVNAELITQLPKRPSANEQNDLQIARNKYESARQRALEFAKQHVPKPTVINDNSHNTDNRNVRSRSAPNNSNHSSSRSLENNVGILMDEDAFQAAKLQELEAKHQQSKAKMEAIKKSLHGL